MRLNEIKSEPLRIIAYIVFTLTLFYLSLGDILPAVTMTFLCMWMCMMPRLTHENSEYKNKLPKFLFKKDFINKFVRIFIPLVLGGLYFYEFMGSSTTAKNPTMAIVMLAIPFVVSLFHHLILSKYENECDWIMPFVCSTLTIIGVEFLTGNIGNLFKGLFPMFFGMQMDLNILWAFMMQIIIVYSIFRILSVILPGRTLAISVVSLIFILFGVIQHYYVAKLGMVFNLFDLINIKDEIALLKILVTENLDVVYLIKAGAIWIFITMVAFLFSKKSSVYSIPVRFKSMICGIVVLAATIVAFSSFKASLPAPVQPVENTYGFTFYSMCNIGAKSEFSDEWKDKILKERCALFGEELPEDKTQETINPSENSETPNTSPNETPTTPSTDGNNSTTPSNPDNGINVPGF